MGDEAVAREPRVEEGRGGKMEATEQDARWVCDRCGAPMVERGCKIICDNCGHRFDCSDLSIYFD